MHLQDGVKAYVTHYLKEKEMELSEEKINEITSQILDSVADFIDIEIDQLL